MKNYRQSADSIRILATADVVGGTLQVINSLIGVAESSVANGEYYTLELKGVFSDLVKKTGEAWDIGNPVYWDGTQLTTTASTNKLVGIATEAALSADTVGTVLIK